MKDEMYKMKVSFKAMEDKMQSLMVELKEQNVVEKKGKNHKKCCVQYQCRLIQ